MKQLELTDEEWQVIFWMNSIAFLNKDLLLPGFAKTFKDVHDKLMKLQADIMSEQVRKLNETN